MTKKQRKLAHASIADCLGLSFGTNQRGFLGGFLNLNDAESINFHCVPNQVLYQAEPLPDLSANKKRRRKFMAARITSSNYSIR